ERSEAAVEARAILAVIERPEHDGAFTGGLVVHVPEQRRHDLVGALGAPAEEREQGREAEGTFGAAAIVVRKRSGGPGVALRLAGAGRACRVPQEARVHAEAAAVVALRREGQRPRDAEAPALRRLAAAAEQGPDRRALGGLARPT